MLVEKPVPMVSDILLICQTWTQFCSYLVTSFFLTKRNAGGHPKEQQRESEYFVQCEYQGEKGMNVPAEFCSMSSSVHMLLERQPETPIFHFGWYRDVEEEEGGLNRHLLSDLQGYSIVGMMPQVLRKHSCYRTLQCVSLMTQDTCKHIRLILALCAASPYSNSGSQSWFPSCSVAWLGDCKRHCSGLLAGVNSTVLRGTMKLFTTRVNKAYLCLREVRTSLIPIFQLENRCTGS